MKKLFSGLLSTSRGGAKILKVTNQNWLKMLITTTIPNNKFIIIIEYDKKMETRPTFTLPN